MEKLVPMLFTTLKGYTKKQFISDLVAGLIVAVIALPLSIALALASGVGPEEGLYTAIVAGFLISALGGSRVQIAGPTAAFASIVAGIVLENGTDGLVLTFVLTVVFDLVVAIGVGIVLACLLFMKRMSEETDIRGWKYVEQVDDDTENLRPVPQGVRIFEIDGPLFFGAAGRIAAINTKSFTKVLVLRMRSVPSIDATAMNALEGLYQRCRAQGVQLVFSHVNEQPMRAMEKAGLVDAVGRENFLSHIDEALEHATALCKADK